MDNDNIRDLELTYRGHRIQVSHENVPDEYLGGSDMIFTVLIDGNKTVVPGIWKAYQVDGEKGVQLVIEAFLDRSPKGDLP